MNPFIFDLMSDTTKLSAELFGIEQWKEKADKVKHAIYQNFILSEEWKDTGIHPTAKKQLISANLGNPYLPAAFNPAGYQDYFDAFGNALAIIFKIHPNPESCIQWASNNIGNLVPAFHPTIGEFDADFSLLKQNYRFEFRNLPHEFHNGGIWPMVNGFWGLANFISLSKNEAEVILKDLIILNAKDDWGFNECFHGQTLQPCGVQACTWSAAGQLLLSNSISKGFYLID